MALYRDEKTGALISSECELSGDWVLVEEKKKSAAKPKKSSEA